MSPGSWEIQPMRATANPSTYPYSKQPEEAPTFFFHSFHFCAQHKHFASDILVPLTNPSLQIDFEGTDIK